MKIRSVAPDNRLYRHLCEVYSDAHPLMHSSLEFNEGVTNGAAFFTIYGGLQDYAYSQLGMLHVTLELGYVKYPPASTLRTEWERNSVALYRFMEQVHAGVRGRVTCRCGGPGDHRAFPANASLTFDALGDEDKAPGRSPLAQRIRTWTDPALGDYHRVLLPGAYSVTVEGCGTAAPSRQRVTVSERWHLGIPTPLVVDFELEAPGDCAALLAASGSAASSAVTSLVAVGGRAGLLGASSLPAELAWALPALVILALFLVAALHIAARRWSSPATCHVRWRAQAARGDELLPGSDAEAGSSEA